MENKEIFENEPVVEGDYPPVCGCATDSPPDKGGREVAEQPVGGDVPDAPIPQRQPWYVDLTREEFIAFRMLTARLLGPLRQRIPTLVMSIVCCLLLGGFAAYEWATTGWNNDLIELFVGAGVVLIPALIFCVYVPHRLNKQAGKQYDRSVQAGMDFCGELFIYPDCIEKASTTVTASVRFDERMLFIETAEMMVITSIGSPAIVLPARCITDEMARAVRKSAEQIPARNRRFIARVKARGEAVAPPEPKAKPEELWVQTFTYTHDEYATVLRDLLRQHFWRMSPMMVLMSIIGALFFGYDGRSILPAIPYFVLIMVLLVVFNLVLPLRRVKMQAESLSAHDLTMQVRLDTMMIHNKLPKGGNNWVLWCDVDHVYEREDFVEIVHNKKASMFIPKRCIPNLDEFDAIVKRCRGEQ